MSELWHSHAPEGYVCPFCELLSGKIESPDNLCALTDFIYANDKAAAIMACDGFGNHGGHVMIIPTQHQEALYDVDEDTATAIMLLARRMTLAMKIAWEPDGTSVRQHNEPAGNQHVWHYHMHVFPRYFGDDLYKQLRHRVPVEVRARKALELRAALDQVDAYDDVARH